MNKKKKGKIKYREGSNNVYQDLGFKNPDEWAAKARIATEIFTVIKKRKLTQKQAGEIFGITQGRVSDLKRGQFDKFSVEKLMSFLNALDYDVEIRIHPKVAEDARVYVSHSSVQFTA